MSTLSPSVADKVAVGTEQILQSSHVSDGPGRIATAPIPSVFMDDRGSIHRLRIGQQRVNLLYSRMEYMRSGYLHNALTHDFVISGKVEVWTLGEEGTIKTIYGPRQYFTVEAYVPHILYFLEDTNMAEWYEGPSEFRLWYYHPYRNIVNVQNSLLESRSSPRHHRLVLGDETTDPSNGNPNKSSSDGPGVMALFWYTASALLIGWLLGAATVVTHPPRNK